MRLKVLKIDMSQPINMLLLIYLGKPVGQRLARWQEDGKIDEDHLGNSLYLKERVWNYGS